MISIFPDHIALTELTRGLIYVAQNALATGTEEQTIKRWMRAEIATENINENTDWGTPVFECIGIAFDIPQTSTPRDVLAQWADRAAVKVAKFDERMGPELL